MTPNGSPDAARAALIALGWRSEQADAAVARCTPRRLERVLAHVAVAGADNPGGLAYRLLMARSRAGERTAGGDLAAAIEEIRKRHRGDEP